MAGGDRIFDDKAKTRLHHPRQNAAEPKSKNGSVGSDLQLDDHLILSKSFSTEQKSEIYKSMDDSFKDILLFLMDCKPNLGNGIKVKYDNICRKMVHIVYTCPQDSSSPSEQENLIAPVCIDMSYLKYDMEELVAALQGCAKIIKEKRE
jgi:hypothetical protein